MVNQIIFPQATQPRLRHFYSDWAVLEKENKL